MTEYYFNIKPKQNLDTQQWKVNRLISLLYFIFSCQD